MLQTKNQDRLICHDFKYACFLGFHSGEQIKKQKISVDIEVPVKNPHAIAFDYFKANVLIQQFLCHKRFKLLEVLTQELTQLLLTNFKISSVTVRVSKFPKDMKNIGCVTCECCRGQKA